jgi:hypothetical protein
MNQPAVHLLSPSLMVNLLLLSVARFGVSMTVGGSHLVILSAGSESASLLMLATGLFAFSALARRVRFSRKPAEALVERLASPEAAQPTPGPARFAPVTT